MKKQEPILLEKIKRAKRSLRKDLRKLTYHEKISRIIEMQKLSKKMTSPNQKKKIFVWSLD